jgi:hypothetical protein
LELNENSLRAEPSQTEYIGHLLEGVAPGVQLAFTSVIALLVRKGCADFVRELVKLRVADELLHGALIEVHVSIVAIPVSGI